ncbi:MAG: hypothetical protein QM757_42805 [Paludibaculum sp.]
MRIQVPRKALLVRFFLHPVGKTLLALSALFLVVFIGVFSYFWVQYSRLIDQKLKEEVPSRRRPSCLRRRNRWRWVMR